MKPLCSLLVTALALSALQAQEKPATPADQKPAMTAPAPPAKQYQPTDVVMWIGKDPVTYEKWQALERGLPPQYKMACQQMGKRQCAEQFALILGLAHLAEEKKMDQTQEFKDQLAFARLQMLMQLGMQDITQRNQTPSEEDIKKYYDAHSADYVTLKLRGIFVALAPPAHEGQEAKPRTDEQAKQVALALRQKIVDGADFTAVAKESSEEESTASKGGDFGSVRKGQLPPRIEKAVFDLKEKEVSQPVQEARGYYLFKVEERNVTTVDQAKPEITSKLQQTKVMGAIDDFKKQFPVKCDEFCGPAAPAQPQTPPAAKQ